VYANIQTLDDSQRALANSDLRLKEALVIGNYTGQVISSQAWVSYVILSVFN